MPAVLGRSINICEGKWVTESGLESGKERVIIPWDLELLRVPCDIDQRENQEEVSRRAGGSDRARLPSRRVSGDTNGEPAVHQAGTGLVALVISLRFLDPRERSRHPLNKRLSGHPTFRLPARLTS